MSREIESALQSFHEMHGEGHSYRPWRDADAKRLGERLDPVLLVLAESDGWASYDDQALWHCDPDEWTGVAAPWLPAGTKQTDVIFRTGFGDLFVWDGTWTWLVLVHDAARMRAGRRMDRMVGDLFQQPDFYINDSLPSMMKRARKRAGRLEPDEMYNYLPVLALGGSESSSNIVRVKAKEALSILAQAAPIEELGI